MDIAELKAKLKEIAEDGANSDREDFNAHDASGGNFDDAYSLGVTDGEISLARDILEWLGGE